MDVCEVEQAPRKGIKEETIRPPLGLSEKNIAVNRRTRPIREVPSRYKAAVTSNSLSSAPVIPRRSPSPNASRTVPTSSLSNSKRAQSAERKRPSTPPSPPRPSTPVQDESAQMQSAASKRVPGGRSEGLWPSSTMRSLCVSFQSDTYSLPITKKEKPVAHASNDHTLKPSANVAHRRAQSPLGQRKATPERKKTPLRGRNASDQSENSKPMDNSRPRVVDQHRPSSRMSGKVSSSISTRNVDLKDKASKASSLPISGRGVSPLRRSSLSDGIRSGLQKTQSEVPSRVPFDQGGGVEYDLLVVETSSTSSDSSSSTTRTAKSRSLPIPGSFRPPSPSKASLLSSSPSRGMLSPSRTRPSSPFPLVSNLAGRPSSTTSVLSFIADYRKGKKGANHIEEVHQLRLLYNRYLQWRFANAQADAAFAVKKITTEKTLYNVWNTTSELQQSVTMKRITLRQLREELKLNSILDWQVAYLDDWALLESEHASSLSEATEALESCTLRLPVTAGARADMRTLKKAICSAVDVMQAMGSSMSPLLSRVEGTNCLVSELADVTTQERAMLDEYVDLLASTAAMQVQENSLRSQLIQLKHAIDSGEQPISTIEIPA